VRPLALVPVALAVLLAAAPSASAHRGSPASVASDYVARLAGTSPPIAGLRATAIGGDIQLRLHVPPGRVVIVLGILGEPFLRFAGGRVAANERSPTASIARVLRAPDVAPTGAPIWHEVARGRAYTFHESRLRPALARRDGRAGTIAIPLRVDGEPVVLRGASWHRGAPTAFVWLLPLAALLVLAGVTIRRRGLPAALVRVLGTLALAAVLVLVVGSTLAAPHARAVAIAEIALAALVAAALLAALLLTHRARLAFAALAAGAVCLLYAIESSPVLTHGYALSRISTGAARAATVVALVAGGWLLVAAGAEIASTLLTPGAGGRSGDRVIGSVTGT
jgi:hypothetical protein